MYPVSVSYQSRMYNAGAARRTMHYNESENKAKKGKRK